MRSTAGPEGVGGDQRRHQQPQGDLLRVVPRQERPAAPPRWCSLWWSPRSIRERNRRSSLRQQRQTDCCSGIESDVQQWTIPIIAVDPICLLIQHSHLSLPWHVSGIDRTRLVPSTVGFLSLGVAVEDFCVGLDHSHGRVPFSFHPRKGRPPSPSRESTGRAAQGRVAKRLREAGLALDAAEDRGTISSAGAGPGRDTIFGA